MADDTKVPLFVLIAMLAEQDGVCLPHVKGCWERKIGPEWWIAINGHDEAQRCSRGVNVSFGHCYVEYNGFPAGLMTPYGGVIAAGRIANEESFAEALQKELRKDGDGNSGL